MRDSAYKAARHSDFLDWYYGGQGGGLSERAQRSGDTLDKEPFGQIFFKTDLEAAFNRGVDIGRQVERGEQREDTACEDCKKSYWQIKAEYLEERLNSDVTPMHIIMRQRHGVWRCDCGRTFPDQEKMLRHAEGLRVAQTRYTVDEMGRMRKAIESADRDCIPRNGDVRTGAIEALLQSYMLNGTSPEELEEKAQVERSKGIIYRFG